MNTTELIRTTIQETNLTDPREIATAVAERTPVELVPDLYAKLLVQEVRMFLSTERRQVFSQARQLHEHAGSGKKPLGKARTRATLVRDWWSEFKATRVHVGDSVWKTLGDCTFEDLRVLHDERASHAESVLQEAQRFDALSKLVEDAGVSTVGELDEVLVRGVFG